MLFFAIEIEAYQPGSATRIYTKGWGVRPWGPPSRRANPAPATVTICASDCGYRTRESDPGGLVPYPALLDQAFALDRVVNMEPTSSSVAAAAGQVILANPNGHYDAVAAALNADGRPMRVYLGAKLRDEARGYYVDPPKGDLTLVFEGVATPWALGDGALTVLWRDPTYLLQQPIQSNTYTGGGGYYGHAGLTGAPKPKARGGVAGSYPIRNVTPVLIDPATNTYQYSDGPGQVVAIYEAGNAVFTFQADTANLFSGSTTAGSYRTDDARACFQLGSTPVGEITCDVVGDFPVHGPLTNWADIAYYLLLEDAAIPAANLLKASFDYYVTAYDYTAGIYIDPTNRETGVQALDRILTSGGAKLIPRRDGKLAMWAPQSYSAVPALRLSPSNIIDIRAEALPPPPWRIAMIYNRNHTRQAAGVSAAASATRRAYIAGPGDTVAWYSSDVAANYARPRDLTIGTALLVSWEAQLVADHLGAYFGQRRRSYWVTVPVEIGIAREIGDKVTLVYPKDDLRAGQDGWISGDRIRSTDGTMQLRIHM